MTDTAAEPVPLAEAARRLGVTTDALRMRFRRGKIEGFRRAGRIFIVLADGVGAPTEQSEHRDRTPAPSRDEVRRLAADNLRLQEQQNRLLTLLEREQVLRQQLQTQLVDISPNNAIPGPSEELADLAARLRETENNFELLKRAVSQLVMVVEGRG